MTAEKNDELRKNIWDVQPPDKVVLTQGIVALGESTITGILRSVSEFDHFSKGDDPYREHDFGAFTYLGNKIYWKIDDYGGIEEINLLLTIMLSGEY